MRSHCSRRRPVMITAGRAAKTAGPTPCRFVECESKTFASLFLVDGFLQFGPRSKFRNLAGGNFDSGAGLRIAPIPCLSLRYRESAETYQCYPISFSQRTSNAAHGSVNRSRSLRLAHFAGTSDLVNQIRLIHSFSSQVSFNTQHKRGKQEHVTEWET